MPGLGANTPQSRAVRKKWPSRQPRMAPLGFHLPKKACKDQFSLIVPQVNSEGIHVWPFDGSCPIDVLFLTEDASHHVPMNRHGYFEVVYLCSGSANCHFQGRLLSLDEGDLVVIGGGLYHRIETRSSSPVTLAALFFEPDLIRCDGGDSLDYLTPFLAQDSDFPHVVPAKSGVPREVLEMIVRIRSELPAASSRARLAVKTYLKMLLLLLVNHFAPFTGKFRTFQSQQVALDRLQPLFRHVRNNYGNAISVLEAARICGMSESYFMEYFRRFTGLSFTKYLNHYRIERAQGLLATTEEPLAAIGNEAGFCDQSYFGVIFRKLVGMTPAAYRQHARENFQGFSQTGPSAAGPRADQISPAFPLGGAKSFKSGG